MYSGYSKYVDYYQAILDKLITKSTDDRILNRCAGIVMGDDAKRFERVQKLLNDFNISPEELLNSDSDDEDTKKSSKNEATKK